MNWKNNGRPRVQWSGQSTLTTWRKPLPPCRSQFWLPGGLHLNMSGSPPPAQTNISAIKTTPPLRREYILGAHHVLFWGSTYVATERIWGSGIENLSLPSLRHEYVSCKGTQTQESPSWKMVAPASNQFCRRKMVQSYLWGWQTCAHTWEMSKENQN